MVAEEHRSAFPQIAARPGLLRDAGPPNGFDDVLASARRDRSHQRAVERCIRILGRSTGRCGHQSGQLLHQAGCQHGGRRGRKGCLDRHRVRHITSSGGADQVGHQTAWPRYRPSATAALRSPRRWSARIGAGGPVRALPPAAVDDVSPRRDGPPLPGSWPDTARCGRSSPTRGWSEPARAAHRSPTSCKDLQGQDRPPGSVDARLSTAAGSLPPPPDRLPEIQQATHLSSLSDIPAAMPPDRSTYRWFVRHTWAVGTDVLRRVCPHASPDQSSGPA